MLSGCREPSDKEHRIIVDAIAAQDKDAAEEAMAFHFSAVRIAVDGIVKKQP